MRVAVRGEILDPAAVRGFPPPGLDFTFSRAAAAAQGRPGRRHAHTAYSRAGLCTDNSSGCLYTLHNLKYGAIKLTSTG